MALLPVSGSLNRTFNPKYTTYGPNGSGRDAYIICQNGGLLPQEKFIVPSTGYHYRKGPTQLFSGSCRVSISPKKEASPLKYISDGSGRDSYVTRDSGGNIPQFHCVSNKTFFSSLRGSPKLAQPKKFRKKDPFTDN